MTNLKCCPFNKSFEIKKNLLVAFVLVLGISSPARAGGISLPDTLQIHGFASQGYIHTSDNNFYGSSQNGSFDFTELGLNASFRPFSGLQLSAQILSRRAGKGDEGDIRLDYGLVDYRFYSNEAMRAGIRIGRIKNPFGLYNDTRDVAFTRPSILLPQSIYFDRARNPALSSEGVHLYGDRQFAFGDLYLQIGAAYPMVEDIETERAFLINDQAGRLDGKLSYIGRIVFEQDGGRIRLGLSGAWVKMDYAPGTADPVGAGTIRFSPLIFSAQYNAESWSLTSEYALRRIEIKNLGAIPDREQTGESVYFQGTYRITPILEALVRYDILYQDRGDRNGDNFSLQSGLPGHLLYSKDWTVGLRWDIMEALMFRIEYHSVDGTAWLPLLDNPDLSSTERYWDLFSILLSYRF